MGKKNDAFVQTHAENPWLLKRDSHIRERSERFMIHFETETWVSKLDYTSQILHLNITKFGLDTIGFLRGRIKTTLW